MGRGHQLVGVWPECPASAKIKTAKISSEESGLFSAKICTGENFPLYGIRRIFPCSFGNKRMRLLYGILLLCSCPELYTVAGMHKFGCNKTSHVCNH